MLFLIFKWYNVIMRFILLVTFILFLFQNKYMCETFVSFRFRHTTNVRANYFSLWKDWGNWIHPRRRAPKRYKKCSYNISYNRRSWRVRIVWIITLFVNHLSNSSNHSMENNIVLFHRAVINLQNYELSGSTLQAQITEKVFLKRQ